MILDCIGKAIFLFLIYNMVTILIFGIPKSLSDTYYLYKGRLDVLKVLFPATIMMLAICLLPCWIDISKGSNFQFLSFLSVLSLAFVGASPTFKDDTLDNKVHNISAIISVICALLWIVLVTNYWYVILIMVAIVIVAATLTKTFKTCYMYWIEVATFMSTFITILLHHMLG